MIWDNLIFSVTASQMKLGHHCQGPGKLECEPKAGSRAGDILLHCPDSAGPPGAGKVQAVLE